MAKKKTTNTKAPSAPEPQSVRTVISDNATAADVPTFYVNNASLDVSTWDIRLRLGLMQRITSEGELHVRDTVIIFMSHPHFAAFTRAVNETDAKLKNLAQLVNRAESTERSD